MTIGPIQAFVIGFPDNDLFEGRIAGEIDAYHQRIDKRTNDRFDRGLSPVRNRRAHGDIGLA